MCLRVLSIRFVLSLTALVLIAVGANLIGIGLFLVVRPFSRAIYRRLASQYVAIMWIDAMSLLLPGTTVCLTGDSDMPDGECNRTMIVDTMILHHSNAILLFSSVKRRVTELLTSRWLFPCGWLIIKGGRTLNVFLDLTFVCSHHVHLCHHRYQHRDSSSQPPV